MPDPKQMSGIPRPVTDLPNGTVSVRVIRGSCPTTSQSSGRAARGLARCRTAKTDEAGRAEFGNAAAWRHDQGGGGRRRRASRVAGVSGAGAGRHSADAGRDRQVERGRAPPRSDAPGGDRRGRDRRRDRASSSSRATRPLPVYYLLDITNNARAPVNPPTPSRSTCRQVRSASTILEGSSPQATVTGTSVQVAGPFPPGQHLVQVGTSAAGVGGSVDSPNGSRRPFEHLGRHRQEGRRRDA